MSDWQNRIIKNDHPKLTTADMEPGFIAEIVASQIAANKGWAPEAGYWSAPSASDLIDRRIVECPDCKSPGMNTCWGYWAFECGAEILTDGDVSEPCGQAVRSGGAPI